MSVEGSWQQAIADETSAAMRGLAPKIAVLAGAGASKALGLPVMNEFFDSLFPEQPEWREKLNGNLPPTEEDFRYWLIRLAYPDPDVAVFDLEQVMLVIQQLQDYLKVPEIVRNGITTLLTDHSSKLTQGHWSRRGYAKECGNTKQRVDRFAAKLLRASDSIIHDFNSVFGEPKELRPDELWVPMLSALAKLTDRGIPLFTTNYDVAFERAATHSPLFPEVYSLQDGLVSDPKAYSTPTWSPSNYGNPEAGDFWLFKLHGSADWCLDGNPAKIMRQTNSTCTFPVAGRQCLRPPYLSKGRPDPETEPWFNAMYAAFEEALRTLDLLVVIGFSFRDDAIRDSVSVQLDGRKDFVVVAVSPDGVPTASTEDGNVYLRELVSTHSPTMIWIRESFSKETIPQLVAGISEAHRQRGNNIQQGTTL